MSDELSRAFPSRGDAACYLVGLSAVVAAVVIYATGRPSGAALLLALWFVIMAALAVRCGRHIENTARRSRWAGISGAQIMWFRLILGLQVAGAVAQLRAEWLPCHVNRAS